MGVCFIKTNAGNMRDYADAFVRYPPLSRDRFVGMLTQAKNCGYVPSPDRIRAFCEYSMVAANAAEDEEAWYADISQKADNWLK